MRSLQFDQWRSRSELFLSETRGLRRTIRLPPVPKCKDHDTLFRILNAANDAILANSVTPKTV